MAVKMHTAPKGDNITEVLWTMLEPLDNNIRLALGARLLESVKEDVSEQPTPPLSEKIKNYKLSPFILSLTAADGEEVPPEENGRDAFILRQNT